MQWFKVMTATEISKKSVETTKCDIPEQKTKETKMLFVFTHLQSWPVGQINGLLLHGPQIQKEYKLANNQKTFYGSHSDPTPFPRTLGIPLTLWLTLYCDNDKLSGSFMWVFTARETVTDTVTYLDIFRFNATGCFPLDCHGVVINICSQITNSTWVSAYRYWSGRVLSNAKCCFCVDGVIVCSPRIQDCKCVRSVFIHC